MEHDTRNRRIRLGEVVVSVFGHERVGCDIDRRDDVGDAVVWCSERTARRGALAVAGRLQLGHLVGARGQRVEAVVTERIGDGGLDDRVTEQVGALEHDGHPRDRVEAAGVVEGVDAAGDTERRTLAERVVDAIGAARDRDVGDRVVECGAALATCRVPAVDPANRCRLVELVGTGEQVDELEQTGRAGLRDNGDIVAEHVGPGQRHFFAVEREIDAGRVDAVVVLIDEDVTREGRPLLDEGVSADRLAWIEDQVGDDIGHGYVGGRVV